jgi:adenylate cyclase
LKKDLQIKAILWGLAGPVIVLMLVIWSPDFITKLELLSIDTRTKLLEVPKADKKIVLFVVDDSSVLRVGKWPWPRGKLGQIIDRLDSLGAKAIVYDFNFIQESTDPLQDDLLTQAMKKSGKVVITMPMMLEPHPYKSEEIKFDTDNWSILKKYSIDIENADAAGNLMRGTRIQLPPESIMASAGTLAINPAKPDSDGVFRRMPIVAKISDRVIPVLGLSPLRLLEKWDFEKMKWEKNHIIIPAFPGKKSSDLEIPVDKDGMMIVNWSGKWGEKIRALPVFYLLEDKLPKEDEAELKGLVEGAIVFVGAAYTGGTDIRPQPWQTAYPMVGIHANTANTVLTGQFRTQSSTLSALLYGLLLCALAILLGLIKRPVMSAIIGVVVLATFILFSLIALKLSSNYIPLIIPALGFIASSGAMTYYKLSHQHREVKFLREQFGPVLPPDVFEQLLENPDSVKFTGDRRQVAVLFSDIKGFTSISDKEKPEVVYDILTEYFGAMTEIIFRYNGTIDKFIGDGIMAIWGAPLPLDNPTLNAAKAAVEMQAVTKNLREKWNDKGWPPIKIRIGINTGNASVGFFGSDLYREYTALGSAVNMAQRLESNCTPGQVMITEKTKEIIEDEFEFIKKGSIPLKGFAEEVEVCEIVCPE